MPTNHQPPVILDEILDGVRHIWRCDPPSLAQTFTVTHDVWSDNDTTRTIYAWRAA